jgi:hypothetical protein
MLIYMYMQYNTLKMIVLYNTTKVLFEMYLLCIVCRFETVKHYTQKSPQKYTHSTDDQKAVNTW